MTTIDHVGRSDPKDQPPNKWCSFTRGPWQGAVDVRGHGLDRIVTDVG